MTTHKTTVFAGYFDVSISLFIKCGSNIFHPAEQGLDRNVSSYYKSVG